MQPVEDSYLTIETSAEAVFKERSSKFLAYAYPISSEEEVKKILDTLRKDFYDATHHCYAWRLGAKGELYRSSDDGEPSGTAGKPILGKLLSKQVTNCLIVVVRYFGGTKLGVPGLITAYKEATQAVLDACNIVERTIDLKLRVDFSYEVMNEVMKVVKEESPRVIEQVFDNMCCMILQIRESRIESLLGRLNKIVGATTEILESV